MAMLTTAGAARRTTGARVGSAWQRLEGEEGDEGGEEGEQGAHGRSVAAKSGKKLAKARACRRTPVDLGVLGVLEGSMTNVLDAYMVDFDLSFLDKAKIQAQVLVPVVRALRAELGKEKADALVKGALGDWSRQMFAAIGKDIEGGRRRWSKMQGALNEIRCRASMRPTRSRTPRSSSSTSRAAATPSSSRR